MDTCSLRYVMMMSRCFFSQATKSPTRLTAVGVAMCKDDPATPEQRSKEARVVRPIAWKFAGTFNFGPQKNKALKVENFYQSNSWIEFRLRFTLLSKFISSEPLDSQQGCTSAPVSASSVAWSSRMVEALMQKTWWIFFFDSEFRFEPLISKGCMQYIHFSTHEMIFSTASHPTVSRNDNIFPETLLNELFFPIDLEAFEKFPTQPEPIDCRNKLQGGSRLLGSQGWPTTGYAPKITYPSYPWRNLNSCYFKHTVSFSLRRHPFEDQSNWKNDDIPSSGLPQKGPKYWAIRVRSLIGK